MGNELTWEQEQDINDYLTWKIDNDWKEKGHTIMARSTIAQRIKDEMLSQGYTFLGQTSGTFSFRKSSNLSLYLIRLGKTESEVVVKAAARAGQHANDGYQLLVFCKQEGN